MSKSSKSSIPASDERISQFCAVTGASAKDAVKFITKYKRLDIAIDAFYNDPNALNSTAQSKSKNSQTSQLQSANLNTLFDQYKDRGGDIIGIDGTVKLCSDLGVDPEDVVLLALAYELKLPAVGEWTRKGWTEGWKNLGCDGTLGGMKTILPTLKQRLGSESEYFNKVYNYTFGFARSEGQRSLSVETACAFWSLLLPHGLEGGAIAHERSAQEDDSMDGSGGPDPGWQPEYVDWWFEFLNRKGGGKGVSKDTWMMLPEFIRTIDSKFENHDLEAAWPSTIDDFVEWAKERLISGSK